MHLRDVSQLHTPVEHVKKRLEVIKALYPEACSDTVETAFLPSEEV
jgi:hypothetical protein